MKRRSKTQGSKCIYFQNSFFWHSLSVIEVIEGIFVALQDLSSPDGFSKQTIVIHRKRIKRNQMDQVDNALEGAEEVC